MQRQQYQDRKGAGIIKSKVDETVRLLLLHLNSSMVAAGKNSIGSREGVGWEHSVSVKKIETNRLRQLGKEAGQRLS